MPCTLKLKAERNQNWFAPVYFKYDDSPRLEPNPLAQPRHGIMRGTGFWLLRPHCGI